MLINDCWNIEVFLEVVCCYIVFLNVNCGKVIVEYVLLDYVNDGIEYVYELVELLKGMFCKINLILFNFYLGLFYKKLSNLCIDCF